MLLAPESRKHIESFLQDHFHNEKLRLPPVHVYCGRFARLMTNSFQILAITFGRRILVAPKVIKLDEKNLSIVPARLIAHEATHVVQYQEAGFAGFLFSYIKDYLRVLREQKQGWGRAARNAAYFGIRQEREAYEAEAAYAVWEGMKSRIQESESRSQNG